jgi:hypothetical protein
MPNLIPFVDTSTYYYPAIMQAYEFIKCEILIKNHFLYTTSQNISNVNIHMYLLTDEDNKHLSIIRLKEITLSGKIYHQINKSYSIISQKGYGEVLYDSCFKYHNVNILSDSKNTIPGSYNLWKKLLNKKRLYKISLYDKINNRKIKINLPFKEYNIWGVDETFLEAIKESSWEAVIFENELTVEEENETDDESRLDYLTEHDKYERTILSDYVVNALQNKNKLKDRNDFLLLVTR